jgi:FtsZ-binding cell division protein ZapB
VDRHVTLVAASSERQDHSELLTMKNHTYKWPTYSELVRQNQGIRQEAERLREEIAVQRATVCDIRMDNTKLRLEINDLRRERDHLRRENDQLTKPLRVVQHPLKSDHPTGAIYTVDLAPQSHFDVAAWVSGIAAVVLGVVLTLIIRNH